MDLVAIDTIINLMQKNEWEDVYKFFNERRLLSQDNWYPYKNKFLKKLASQIDDNCFSYLYNYFSKNECVSLQQLNIFAKILRYMSDKKKKMCIDTGMFENTNLTEIIKSVDDIEYKKKYVENSASGKLNSLDKKEIIENINQLEYTKQCIERHNEIGIDSNEIFELVKSTKEPDFIKQCIFDDKERKNKYKLHIYQILELVCLTNDDEFMEKCIENREEYGFSISQLYDIIININDVAFLKECVEKRRDFQLNRNQLVEIIKKTNDFKYIFKCIVNKKEYNFLSMHIFDIIKDIKEPKFIRKCLDLNYELGLDSYMIKCLLKNLDDPEFTKKYIENYKKFKINSFTVTKIIDSLNNPTFTRKCIFNKKLELDSSEIKYLIISLKDKKNIKECILKAKKIGLNSEDIESLIGVVASKEFTKKCILRAKQLGIKSSGISEMIINLQDEEFAKKCIKNNQKIGIDTNELKYLQVLYDKKYNKLLEMKKSKSKIKLPDEMTIGIEIESCGRSRIAVERLKKIFFNEWDVEKDDSIKPNKKSEYGVEISSPIFKGSDDNNNKKIGNVCKILQDINNYTNESCGGHIHIGADYLKTTQGWKNLLELWSNTEEILYIISNDKGNIPRKNIITYAVPISLRIKKSLKKEKIKLNEIKDVQSLKKEIKRIMNENYRGIERYRGINFNNITNIEEKNTIEIRMPNGTINQDVWIQNINLFGGIVKISQELADIQSKEEKDLTKEEKQKINLFKEIKKKKIKNREKLQILLELIIDKNEQINYLERYDINNKLLKREPEFRQKLKVDISKKPVKINKKIGKKEKVKQSIIK